MADPAKANPALTDSGRSVTIGPEGRRRVQVDLPDYLPGADTERVRLLPASFLL
jgi:hypothetical protein